MLFLQPTQKRFLSSLNPCLMVLTVLGLITVRTTVDPWLPLMSGLWDVLFAWVIYLGQRRTLLEGGALVLFGAHLYSLSSAAPFGVFVIFYSVIFLASRLLTYVIYANTGLSVMGLLLALSVFSRFLLWVIASGFGHGLFAFSTISENLSYCLMNTLAGLIVYFFVGTLDRLTFKLPRISIEMAEDGF